MKNHRFEAYRTIVPTERSRQTNNFVAYNAPQSRLEGRRRVRKNCGNYPSGAFEKRLHGLNIRSRDTSAYQHFRTYDPSVPSSRFVSVCVKEMDLVDKVDLLAFVFSVSCRF